MVNRAHCLLCKPIALSQLSGRSKRTVAYILSTCLELYRPRSYNWYIDNQATTGFIDVSSGDGHMCTWTQVSNIDTPFDSLSFINLENFMSYAQDVYDRARLSNILLDCSIQSKYLGRFLLAKLPGRMSWNGRVNGYEESGSELSVGWRVGITPLSSLLQIYMLTMDSSQSFRLLLCIRCVNSRYI